MELLKIDDHFIVSDFVSNGSFASLRENVQYKSNEDYAILVRITDFVKKWNGDYVYINETEYNFLNKSKVFPGDLIISNVGQPGLSFILPNLNKKTSLAPNSIFVRPKTDKVYNLYFYYFLKTPDAQKIIESICTQTTLKKFNKTSFRNLILPFPSYENQIRIANLLGKIETAIAERKNAIDLLDELVKATFFQMFGDPAKILSSSLISLDEISIQITDGEHTTPKRTDKGIKLLSARNIQNGYLNFSKGVDYIDQNEYERISKRCKPEYNDVLMSCSGTIGRVAVINIHEPLTLVRSVALIKPKHDIVNSYYLMHWLQSTFLQNEISRNSKKSSQANIFTGAIKQLPIFVPSIILQNQFADIAQKIELIKTKQEVQLKDLKELYTSVSHKVFGGDIDLSKVPFDANLLPNPIEVTKKVPTEKHDVILQQASKEEIKKVITPTKGKITWESVSFKEVADYIQHQFKGHYFNTEMLLRLLREDMGMFVNYFSSAEQKKNPQYENADDFYRFIATALTGENHFLTLEQVFYNAETENIPNISFTETDLESLSKKDKKERSGIYFHIKDETTTS